MPRPDESYDRTLAEIAGEKAAALARIATALEAHLAGLAGLREALASASAGPERDRLLAACLDQWEQARLWRWYLIVQREALGLLDHEAVDRHYPIPSISV